MIRLLWALAIPIVCCPVDLPKLQLFLLIGQSNMAGRGAIEPEDKQPIPHVFALNKDGEWVPAIDPVHFDKPKLAGVGIARTFGRVLAATDPSVSIGLIPAAVGGTSLDQWKPGGELYEDAVRRAKIGMKSGKLRGILWHQGESDGGDAEKANSYAERWAVMIRQLRSDLNEPDVPVVVGELAERTGELPPGQAFVPKVNEQLALLPLRTPHTAFASSAGLTTLADHAHFDARSQRELGRRYALAFLSLDPSWPMAGK